MLVTLLAVFMPSAALAASFEGVVVGSQPLASEADLLLALEPHCGTVLGTTSEDATATYTLGVCDLMIDRDRGRFQVLVLGDAEGASEKLSSSELDSRTLTDIDLLESLGFDVSEFTNASTGQLAAEDRDEATGRRGPPRYLASKTLIERRVAGFNVPENRVVVTRDQAGNLRKIIAAWPTFDESTVLTVSSSLTEDVALAQTRTSDDVISAALIMIIGDTIEGAVNHAVVCVEVIRHVEGPEDRLKPTARYFLDGDQIDPRTE